MGIFAAEGEFISVLILCKVDPELECTGIQILRGSFQSVQIDCSIQIAFSARFLFDSYDFLVWYCDHT